ncbi:MAG: amidinotransferase [Myxococcales bacterium FL481]|nr:MAG: amidinotransferase [Myxococcales bacterium FL481]
MSNTDLFLMSPPAVDWAIRGKANFRSAAAAAVDPRGARLEWISLADAIEQRGGRVVCLVPPAGSGLTGLPYAAECGHVVDYRGELVFLLPNMAVEHRRSERALWSELAVNLGLQPRSLPGIWEAQGDVAAFDGCTLLFYGGRTDATGLAGAQPYFEGETLTLRLREPAFHGNMAVLPLSAVDRLVVCPEVICDDGYDRLRARFGDDRILRVTEAEIRCYATNGLPLGRQFLAPHLVPSRVRAMLEEQGMEWVELEMRELCEKAGGASRCLVSHAHVDINRLTIDTSCDYRHLRGQLLAEVGA